MHDWVAELECGHTQHVRHDPPWTNRPWVSLSRDGTALSGIYWTVYSATAPSQMGDGPSSSYPEGTQHNA